MKRGRTEEIQFGQPRAQPPPGQQQQRIITTSQPHNVASAGGSTIQYQIPPNIIKTTTSPDSNVSASNLSTQQQTAQLAPPQQTVQYTTYNSSIGSNLAKSQQATNQQQTQQQQQQQIHLGNATTQGRGTTAGHKGAVVNASSITSVAGVPTSGTGIVGGGVGGQVTSMSPGVQPQGPPTSAPQGQAQLQRLKVEDALSYLDQVKYRFGNQPQVYNDFLDIMKEFKSQSIDTPGVIQRVSNLFKGHPELIVGFNTFLPPGYKIELQANDQGYAFQVSVSMPSSSTTGTSIAQQPSPHKYNTIFQGGGQIVQQSSGGTNVVNASSGGTTTTAVNLMPYGGSGHAAATVATAAAPASANAPSHGGGSLQQTTGGSVGNASPATAQNAQSMTTTTSTGTVPQVPQSFSSRSDLQLHQQQQQQHHRERTISTGSVTSNASLPPGASGGGSSNVTSTVVTAVDNPQQQQQQQQQAIHRMISQQVISQQQQTATVTSTGVVSAGVGVVAANTGNQAQQQHLQHTTTPQQQQQQQPPAGPSEPTAAATVPAAPPTATPSAAVVASVPNTNQPVEFNHAISYVNKIKNRFHSEPEKYKRFLEILHTYQKEQKTYKEGAASGGSMANSKQLTEAEVYTQVAQLFDNQEDLLREFGQFLPDATGHHNQGASQQQHHVSSGGNKNNHMFVNAVLHDSQQQQQQQQQQMGGGGAGTASVVTGSTPGGGAVVHTSGGKKLVNSGAAMVGGGGGLTNSSLKMYNSLQQARLHQERDYSPMSSAEGKEYSMVPSVPVGSISGGAGGVAGGRGGGNVVGGVGPGSVVLMEKDRNHIAGGGGTGGAAAAVAVGAGINAKYIHSASLATIAATGSGGGLVLHGTSGTVLASGAIPPGAVGAGMVPVIGNLATSGGANAIKRSPSYSSQIVMSGVVGSIPSNRNDRVDGTGPPPIKRHKPICRDVSLAEASKYGTLNDYAFFDKVRKALRSPDSYENFLRCLTLYNQEIVSKSELITLVSTFLSRFPDLLKWFQDFLGPSPSGVGSGGGANECVPLTAAAAAAAARQDRSQGELAADIDLSTCKRLGASYCALPKSHESVKCSGRTSLCRDVLNDTWVSFPTWAEDSTFVTSRKTQYEEFIYRCEDERFELDVVIETNSATIRVLEGIQKRITRMSQDEISRFRLDDCLGGTSPTIHQRALKRIYGDKAADMIQGLKKNPAVAVPVVLRRMKAKEEEWREAQKSFNKQWRDQNEKYYLKSLDHQGINFKQTDIKALRSKSLFNEIETLFDERHEQNDDSSTGMAAQTGGPHMTIPYKDKGILEDAANLLIHHVKRQTGIQKQEKARIKHILRQFVPDLFFAPRQQMSEDEREEDGDQDEDDCGGGKSSVKKSSGGHSSTVNNSTTNSCNLSSSNAAEEMAAPSSGPSKAESVNSANEGTCGGGGDGGIGDGAALKTAASSETVSTKSTGVSSGPNSSVVSSGTSGSTNQNSASNGNGENNQGSSSATPLKMEIKDDDFGTATAANNNNGASAQDHQVLNRNFESAKAADAQQPMSPPLPPHAVSKHIEEAYTLFFTNNNWYLFLRLHAILCERLRTIYERAQIIAAEERAYESTRNSSTATALRLKPKSEIRIEEYYNIFLDMLKNLLDGNMESSSYEDTLREMFGIHAYSAFTLDRVVQNAVRQLQHCVTERGAMECVELFQNEQRRGGAGGLCRTANRRIAAELAYQRKAESALQDENCFKIYIYKIDCRVTMELLDTESDDTANNFASSQTYSSYVDRLSNPAATGTGSDSGGGGGGGGGGGDGATAASGNVVADGTATSNVASSGSGGVGAPVSNHNNNSAMGASNTSSGGSSSVAAGGGGGAGSGEMAEIKTEKPEDDMVGTLLRRRPVFLSRNIRQKSASIKPKGRSHGDALEGADKISAIPSGTTPRPDESAKPAVGTFLTAGTKQDETLAPSMGKESAAANKNNNVPKVTSSSNTGASPAGSNQQPEGNSSLWNNGKSSPEQSSSLNGSSNRNVVLCMEDTADRSTKIPLVDSKNFVFFRPGSLIRSRKNHPVVTTRMCRKFQAIVDRWLDHNASTSQRRLCTDWLLGKHEDLSKNLTTVVVNVTNSERTPYKPYSRYKVSPRPVPMDVEES